MATHIEVTKAVGLASQGLAQTETFLIASQTITPSGSNQATTFSNLSFGQDPGFVTVTADENVFISIGTAPNALTDPAKRAMPAGGVRSFAFARDQQVAVVLR